MCCTRMACIIIGVYKELALCRLSFYVKSGIYENHGARRVKKYRRKNRIKFNNLGLGGFTSKNRLDTRNSFTFKDKNGTNQNHFELESALFRIATALITPCD